MRFISYIFIIVGLAFIGYSGFKLYSSHAMEKERLDTAVVSNDVISTVDEDLLKSFDYGSIKMGETIGVLYIPKLEREIPIIEGTDEEELAQGVGHYKGTGFPGENKQILLSGHRDTVFRQFDKLEDGDEFHIKMKHGTFIYVIRDKETVIVPADDTTVIDPNRDDEVLTVSTCYPFSFIGSAPDRYVLYAYPKQEN